jgi:hypothetical protein
VKASEEEEPRNYVNEAWANIRVMEAAITVLGYKERPERNDWFNEECKTALTLKNQAYKARLSRSTWIKRTEYEKQRIADKLCRKKKSLGTMSGRFKENDLHMTFKEVKSLKEGFKPSTQLTEDSQGNIIGDRVGIGQRWKEYFEVLLNGTGNKRKEMDEYMELEEDLDIIELPTLDEVQDSLKALRNNKAPGADNLPAELLKYEGNEVTKKKIHDLITLAWEKEQIPKEWRKSIIILIHKKDINWTAPIIEG